LGLLFCSSKKSHSQQADSCGYYKFNNEGQLEKEQLILVRTDKSFEFCFKPGVEEIFYDSVADGRMIKMLGHINSTACLYCYGKYGFKKKGNYIYLVCNIEKNKRITNKQYPLRPGDTTSFACLFCLHNGEYLNLDGSAFQKSDTIIKSYTGIAFDCFVFNEQSSPSIDIPKPGRRIIYLDKNSLLPVRYDFLNFDGRIEYIYLLNKSFSKRPL